MFKRIILVFVVGIISIVLLDLYLKDFPYKNYLYAAIIFIFGSLIAEITAKKIKREKIHQAEYFSSLSRIVIYLIIILVVVSYLGISGGNFLVAGGAFSGLIIGLAIQPVLANFFAGIIIILTKFVEIGDRIKILSAQIPFSITVLPPYKFFSVDNLDVGYDGKIVEIGLFFSKLITTDRKEIKIPNSILLSSAIMDYKSEEVDFQRIVSLRVEFPLEMKKSYNLDILEKEILKSLKEFKIIEGPYFSEQSDKDHVLVMLKIDPEKRDWKLVKSMALKNLLKLRQKIKYVKS